VKWSPFRIAFASGAESLRIAVGQRAITPRYSTARTSLVVGEDDAIGDRLPDQSARDEAICESRRQTSQFEEKAARRLFPGDGGATAPPRRGS
jgi:hypothetical protein